MKTTTTTLSKLARDYNVHVITLKKWLADYPELKLNKSRRTLTPKQVQDIYKLIGEP